MNKKNHIGEKYGLLTIIKETGKFENEGTKNQSYIYQCLCECGNICEKSFIKLKHRKNPNCGCLENNKQKDEYNIWCDIKKRCYNKNSHAYYRYGGRGIKMYEDWKLDFKNFYFWLLKNIGLRPSKKHSIDRINVNGNYEPGNIRWTTIEEQNQNQRQVKLNPEIIQNIRNEYKNWNDKAVIFIKNKAEQYNVNIETIRQILKKQTWKNIK